MEYRFRVSCRAGADLPWLPGLRRSLQRHVNHHRRSDDVLSWHAADEAAVVGILPVVAHDEIAVRGNSVGSMQFVRPADSLGIILGELLSVDPHRAIANVYSIPRQADHALHPGRRFLGNRRPEDHHLLAFRVSPEWHVPVSKRHGPIVPPTPHYPTLPHHHG